MFPLNCTLSADFSSGVAPLILLTIISLKTPLLVYYPCILKRRDIHYKPAVPAGSIASFLHQKA